MTWIRTVPWSQADDHLKEALDNERNLDAPGLPGLAKVLKAFPDVNFIAHGPGW